MFTAFLKMFLFIIRNSKITNSWLVSLPSNKKWSSNCPIRMASFGCLILDGLVCPKIADTK